MSLEDIKTQDSRYMKPMLPVEILEALCRDAEAVESGWVREALAEAALDIRTKDKEIHDLKEQVASLQRALAHNRDRDSVVDS